MIPKQLTEAMLLKVLTERTLSRADALKSVGLSHTSFYRMTEFRKKYQRELKEASRHHYAESKFGNRYGSKDQPSQVIPREAVHDALQQRLTIPAIARKFSCSEFLVRRNIEHHRLAHVAATGRLPYMLRDYNRYLLQRMETFQEGLIEAAETVDKDPEHFFELLHTANLRLIETLWFVKKVGRRSSYYTGKSKGWCWSSNRYEACLTIALKDAGIPYHRQFPLQKGPGTYFVDFLLAGKLFVEVDGKHHTWSADAIRRDKEKEALIALRGIPLLRFKETEVWRNTAKVMQVIKAELARLDAVKSKASSILGSKKSGTSVSKKTKATSHKAL